MSAQNYKTFTAADFPDLDFTTTEKITVVLTADYFNSTNRKRLIAAKGRTGKIYADEEEKIGTTTYLRVQLEGNKVRRDIPAWLLKKANNKVAAKGITK